MRTVEVWCCAADTFTPWHADRLAERWSDDEELAAIARKQRLSDRHLQRVAHLLARRVLTRCTGVPEPALRIERGPLGRPWLRDAAVDFNLSHGGGWAAVACGPRTVGVGVDVESLDSVGNGHADLARAFAPAERRALAELEPASRPLATLRLWSLKEALVKADGAGLRIALDGFTIEPAPVAGAAKLKRLTDGDCAHWMLLDVHLAPDVVLAVAVHGTQPIDVRLHPPGFPPPHTRHAPNLDTGAGPAISLLEAERGTLARERRQSLNGRRLRSRAR